jgi:hypothetical protein
MLVMTNIECQPVKQIYCKLNMLAMTNMECQPVKQIYCQYICFTGWHSIFVITSIISLQYLFHGLAFYKYVSYDKYGMPTRETDIL